MSTVESICLVGWGAIGQRVAALLKARGANARIVGIAVRDAKEVEGTMPEGAVHVAGPEALAAIGATLVVEAASRESVLPFARAALSAGMDFAVSSTSALVDAAVLDELVGLARRNDCKLIIPPGALGGIDALSAAARLGLDSVEHVITKPARAWLGTPAQERCRLGELEEAVAFFEGSAAEAATAFPQNANVAATTSLAGIGMQRTRVRLVADPKATENMHCIHAHGAFGTLEIRLQNRPLATNPKSSEMTALNLVRMIENRSNPLVL
ncbi:MAG TPA: aspartate dehydrogenase [Ensifer sp.]|jgi:aspartate dehydrogenase|uniref:aspartate dehydrogenase n=1 Tax=Ensifer sp. TaxID=1872086 RepID=UPI002E119A9B|nr:aspartate dehydrogenase [Ensifer sp.]